MESLIFYLFKHTVKLLLSPLILSSILCLIAWVCHLKQKNNRCVRYCAIAGASWLLLSSQYLFSNALLRPIEYAYPIVTLNSEVWQQANFLYTPGCYFYAIDTVEVSQWPRCSLTRLTQTAMMAKHSRKPIIVSAGHFLDDVNINYAAQAKQFLNYLVDSPVIAISEGTNTEQELIALFAFTGDKPIAVITSATHMPRLMLIAKRIGFTQLIPVPVEHLSPPEFKLTLNLPSTSSLEHTKRALYEYIGLLYEALK